MFLIKQNLILFLFQQDEALISQASELEAGRGETRCKDKFTRTKKR
jgi:hypothetical protein